MNRNNIISCSFRGIFLLFLFTMCLNSAFGQVDRFKLEGSRAIEVWRITDDPTIRDHANYHNTQCWSPDGRYLCYTHYGADDKGAEISRGAEIHLYDLYKHRDIKIENGSNPRWANKHNWLFFTQSLPKDDPSYGKGTRVMWLDIETQRLTRIAYGLQTLKETDCDDRWLYGYQTLADRKREKIRVSIRADSRLEALPGDWGVGYNSLYINPSRPMVVSRDHNYEDYLYAEGGREKRDIPYVGRHFLDHDLDGSNRSVPFPIMDGSHFSWDGSGSYFLAGNYQARGKRWDEPLPSNIHFLSAISFGDICPCGFSGRWICGSTGGGRGPLRLADTRSGDGWEVLKNHSYLCFPGTRDNSGPYDIDAKGSPDGTKIAFISTYDIKNGPWTEVTEDVTGDVIKVKSTKDFPAKGRLVNHSGFGGEVLSYERKTETSFEGLTRALYDTNPRAVLRKGQTVTSFESRLIPEAQWNKMPQSARARPIRNTVKDMDSPLMRQKMSDLYVAVVRFPDRPYLQKVEDYVELIPGENHWETAGYYVFRDGKKLTNVPIKPGTSLLLPGAGTYTAIAVERSGLESKNSLPLDIQGRMKLKVLKDKPSDFSWTYDRWSVGGKEVSEEDAKRAAESVKEIVHLYDGVIHWEWYNWGQIVRRYDLNLDGKPIRRLFYQDGRLVRREYHNSDGKHVSTELFDGDGYITEAIQYSMIDGKLIDTNHWWYEKAVPVKNIKNSARGTAVYMKDGNRWVRE